MAADEPTRGGGRGAQRNVIFRSQTSWTRECHRLNFLFSPAELDTIWGDPYNFPKPWDQYSCSLQFPCPNPQVLSLGAWDQTLCRYSFHSPETWDIHPFCRKLVSQKPLCWSFWRRWAFPCSPGQEETLFGETVKQASIRCSNVSPTRVLHE